MAVINGACTGTGYTKYNLWSEWTVTGTDTVSNPCTHTVNVKTYIQRNDGYANSAYNSGQTRCYKYNKYDSANEDGATSGIDTRNSALVLLKESNFTIAHETDGTKNVLLEGGFTLLDIPSLTGGSYSAYVDLPTIPREATITSATTHTIETSLSYGLNNPAGYYVKLVYQIWNYPTSAYTTIKTSNCGTLSSGTLTFSGAENTDMYNNMPSNTNAPNKLIAYTYSDAGYSTQIGTAKEQPGYTYVNESINKPSVTATVIDSNATTVALTNSNAILVKYYSNAQFAITASTGTGATISSYSIVCGNKSATTVTGTLNAIESGTFDIIVTDTRGYTNTNKVATVTKTIVPYVKLSLNPLFKRVSSTSGEIELTYGGNYYNTTFGASGEDNTLELKYRWKVTGGVYSDYIALTPTLVGNSYNNGATALSLGSGFTYTNAYVFEIVTTDELMTFTNTPTVLRGKASIYGNDTQVGVNGELVVNDKTMLDLTYPVGALYISAVSYLLYL